MKKKNHLVAACSVAAALTAMSSITWLATSSGMGRVFALKLLLLPALDMATSDMSSTGHVTSQPT